MREREGEGGTDGERATLAGKHTYTNLIKLTTVTTVTKLLARRKHCSRGSIMILIENKLGLHLSNYQRKWI